jgi:hypothetical protein
MDSIELYQINNYSDPYNILIKVLKYIQRMGY